MADGELEHLRAEKQAAVDAEAYEDAGEIKHRIQGLERQLGERYAFKGLIDLRKQ